MGDGSKILTRLSGFVLMVVLLVLWEVVAHSTMVAPGQLPPFSSVMSYLLTPETLLLFVREAAVTVLRVVGGFILGGFWGVMLGFCCGAFSVVQRSTGLIIEGLRPMPSVALVPLSILFLGMGDQLNIVVAAFAATWPVFISTRDGVRSASRLLRDTGRTLGFSPSKILLQVVWPAALPAMMTGLRIGLGIAVAVEVSVEMILPNRGLGSLAMQFSLSGRERELYAAVLSVGALGFCMHKIFGELERMLLRRYGLRLRRYAAPFKRREDC